MRRNSILGSILAGILLAGTGWPVQATAAPAGGPQDRVRRERGDFEVRRGEVLETDLVVEGGNLTVEGVIEGSVVVSNGDAYIRGRVRGPVVTLYGDVVVEDDGLIEGDAVSVSGEVILRGAGRVRGANISTTTRGLQRQPDDVDWARIARRSGLLRGEESARERASRERDIHQRWENRRYRGGYDYLFDGHFPLGDIVYNRVDGFTVQGELIDSHHTWDGAGTLFYGGAGYGFTSKRFYYRLGLSRWFVDRAPIEVGVSLYKQLETEDGWFMTPNENDWMSLLARYDWYDYYLREGLQGHLQFSPTPWMSLGVKYSQDNESPVIRRTNWSLFGGDRVFRENDYLTAWDPDETLRTYAIAEVGETRRFTYFLRLRTNRSARYRPRQGIVLEAWYEQAGDNPAGAGGDFFYERAVAQLQAYQRLSPVDHLALRVRAGTARGLDGVYAAIPVQHRFYLGGIGSLRGYDYKQFTGDRLFLATLEYTLGGDWISVLGDWGLGFFYDYGLAWQTDTTNDLWSDLLPQGAMRSVGAAVTPGWIGGMRLEIARPLDGVDDSFHYYLRWEFDF